jgi:VanZ family protein
LNVEFLRELAARLRVVPPVVGAALTIAWIALIWTLSSHAPADLSRSSQTGSWLTNLAHAPEHAGLALWIAIAARRKGTDVAPAARLASWIVASCLVHGIFDELHQASVPGRDASVLDVVTDLCGAVSAIAVLRAADDGRRFRRAILRGLAACIVAAALATFVPRMAPEISWL